MQTSHLVWLLVLAFCFLRPDLLRADPANAPFVLDKAYSVQLTAGDPTIETTSIKLFVDNGKIRMETSTKDREFISILRPDKMKVYSVIADKNEVVVRPYDARKVPPIMPPGPESGAKYEATGSAMFNGATCTKYKITASDNTVSYMWVDVAKKIPVGLVSPDNSTVLFQNYKAGPQDATLFEPPAGYTMVERADVPPSEPTSAPASGK